MQGHSSRPTNAVKDLGRIQKNCFVHRRNAAQQVNLAIKPRRQPSVIVTAETAQRANAAPSELQELQDMLEAGVEAEGRRTAEEVTSSPSSSQSEVPQTNSNDLKSLEERPLEGPSKTENPDSRRHPRQGQRNNMARTTDRGRLPKGKGPPAERKPTFSRQGKERQGPIEDFPYKIGDFILGKVIWEDSKIGWRVEFVADDDIVALMPPMYKPYTLKDNLEDFWLHGGSVGLIRMFQIEKVPHQMYYNGKGPVVSARGWDFHVIWKRAAQVQAVHAEKTDTLAVNFRNNNDAGLLGVWDGIPLFVPWRLACPYHKNLPEQTKLDAIQRRLTEEKSYVRIVDVDPVKNRFVGNLIDADQIRALEGVQIGDLMEGVIAAVESYGVFVRMGRNHAIKGLLHIRNVSQARTNDLHAIFKVGQPVKAFLFDVDERNQVEYSTLELEQYPGEMLEESEKVLQEAETRGKFWDLHDKVRGAKKEQQHQRTQQLNDPNVFRPSGYKPGSSGDELEW